MKALIAIDGSPAMGAVIDRAADVLSGLRVTVTLLHVVSLPPTSLWSCQVVLVDEETPATENSPLHPMSPHRTAVAIVPRYMEYRLADGEPADMQASRPGPSENDACGARKVMVARAASLALLRTTGRRLYRVGVTDIVCTSGIGDPGDIILTTAARQGVDLIFIGERGAQARLSQSTGEGSPRHSVADRVRTYAGCAVLVVPPPPIGQHSASEVRSVLVAR